MNASAMEDRIVEVIFKRDGVFLNRWLNSLGLKSTLNEGVIVAINPITNYRTGFHSNDDPTTIAVCVASVIFSPHLWMKLLPNLMQKTNKVWQKPEHKRGKKKD